MRAIAGLFKALSEETRLEIVALLLRHGELCVCDVQEVLEVTQSKASRHLRYLLASGLIQDRRDGLWSRYRVADAPTPEQAAVLGLARRLLTGARVAELERRYDAWRERKRRSPPASPVCCEASESGGRGATGACASRPAGSPTGSPR